MGLRDGHDDPRDASGGGQLVCAPRGLYRGVVCDLLPLSTKLYINLKAITHNLQ